MEIWIKSAKILCLEVIWTCGYNAIMSENTLHERFAHRQVIANLL